MYPISRCGILVTAVMITATFPDASGAQSAAPARTCVELELRLNRLLALRDPLEKEQARRSAAIRAALAENEVRLRTAGSVQDLAARPTGRGDRPEWPFVPERSRDAERVGAPALLSQSRERALAERHRLLQADIDNKAELERFRRDVQRTQSDWVALGCPGAEPGNRART